MLGEELRRLLLGLVGQLVGQEHAREQQLGSHRHRGAVAGLVAGEGVLAAGAGHVDVPQRILLCLVGQLEP